MSEHSPLPWSIRNANSLEFGDRIIIDTGSPDMPGSWGGVAFVLNAAFLMSSNALQEEKHQVAIANAKFIKEACNNYYALTGRVKALERALQDTLAVMEHDWPEYEEAQRLLTKDNV